MNKCVLNRTEYSDGFADGYKQGRADVISEIRNMLEFTADKCNVQIDKDLQMIFYGIMQTIEDGGINGAINQLKVKKHIGGIDTCQLKQ